MTGLFRAGRWAAALTAVVVLFATPGQSLAQSRVQQAFSASAPIQTATQASIQQALSAGAPSLSAAPFGLQQPSPVHAPAQAPLPTESGIQQTAPVSGPAPVLRTLKEMVTGFVNRGDQDEEQLCLAKAIYFEARGESLEGQLAVAEVVLNRAASGRYPPTICAVVTQPWQFSFVRDGRFPSLDLDCPAWLTALAIADIARNRLADQIPSHVLWYHANYVSPSWGRRLTRVARIGAHIFYGEAQRQKRSTPAGHGGSASLWAV